MLYATELMGSAAYDSQNNFRRSRPRIFCRTR